MYPSGSSTLSSHSNRVFFANGGVSVAFDSIPIERKLMTVFNPSEEAIYLGGENVTTTDFVTKIEPGKLEVVEAPGNDVIYCVNTSGNWIIAFGSEYY